ncbi:glycoside hydrolase family 13 protein [Lentithecium fluviatile CBS 122367]|uniref:Glycoside hydrolase family 13 protein n=1 Tax=Lentithecium fluviatile CBS 122367 TaxID=1168545 RepID=A0A6G1JNM8_9PLEO|nr:glycoside hydrolase family 13 protein [Lentithecium fluviatile CBS 122367]
MSFPPTPPKSPQLNAKRTTPPSNPVLFEAFEWHSPADHKHWQRLRRALPSLSAIGITDLWLPPGSKAKDAESNGYDIYDAWDLGEFDQKGTVPTKWGTKMDLMNLAADCKHHGLGLVWDAILNHRSFADATETVRVVEVDPKDRRVDITEPFDIAAWTRFDFAARKGRYSTLKFNKSHFNGTDWDQRTEKRAIYRFVEEGKNWAQDVGKLQGNADYLMLENLDYSNPEVVEETTKWGEWIVEELGLSGFRLDAVQHYSYRFVDGWTQGLKKKSPNGLMCVGEFWHGDVKVLLEWLKNMSPNFMLYDVPLLYRIARLSWHEDTDLRAVFKDTLVERKPESAVTFIRIHDTQKGQDMDTPIKRSFTPHAYSLLLLRQDGVPCAFFGDLYGISGPHPEPPSCWGKLPGLILARKLYAHGAQTDYFARKDCIGWVRHGNSLANPDSLAVIMSWTKAIDIQNLAPSLGMNVGKQHAGEIWTDVLGFEWAAVVIDEDGWGRFPCQRNSIACFVSERADGREMFPMRFDSNFHKLVA